jgi:hypothetical protein
MTDDNIMAIKSKERYCHRLCQDGTPLHYYAIVAEKQQELPDAMVGAF